MVWVSGLGCKVEGLGFRVRVSNFGGGVHGAGVGGSGGSRGQGCIRFEIYDLAFGVQV